jgi:DNA-binding LacI/PurR family transcriptional regulator
VSVVGYDDTYLAAFEHINLTSVHQQRISMGRVALQLLLERVDEARADPRHLTLQPALTVRGSTAPPRPETR